MFKFTPQAVKSAVVAATLAMSTFSLSAQAGTITHTGYLNSEDEIVSFTFTTTATDNLTITGYGYDNNNLTGFDSQFGLYDASGALVSENDDVSFDHNSGITVGNLVAGTYTLYVGVYEIVWPNTLGTITSDASGDYFDGYYALNITSNSLVTGNTISPVPEPAAAWLFGSGLVGLVGLRRRKQEV